MKTKKVIFSLSIFIASLFTMIATTFAWVGITTNSTFDEFSLNLKTDTDSGDYGIQLSLTGRTNSFSDSIDSVAVKRQLLKNLGYSNSIDSASDEYVNMTFAKQSLDQCTPLKNNSANSIFESNELQQFESMLTGYTTKKFLWLDVYATMYVAKANVSSDVPLSVFLRESILSADEVGTAMLTNTFTYPATPYELNGMTFPTSFLNKKFSGNVRVNPASAARVCVQTFEPTDLYYLTNNTLIDYKIYQYDENMPSYDSSTSTYSFGGILPSEYNMAYNQYNLMHFDNPLTDVPDWQVNRGDITYKDEGYTGCICYNGANGNRNDNLTVGQMIKFRIYFWFEGWDSDCFEVIDRKTVNVNLLFSNKAPFDI
ncbi:MAG: hypothetical protein K6A63_01695 [Acholeplasmatales bacterium]|nr:hypothetical protein [Acholeplasmatales bacterium]